MAGLQGATALPRALLQQRPPTQGIGRRAILLVRSRAVVSRRQGRGGWVCAWGRSSGSSVAASKPGAAPDATASLAAVQAATPLPPPPPPQGGGPVLITVSANNAVIALVSAAAFAISGCVSVFMLVMVPMLKATEKAMLAMETASRATEKASLELEALMLSTQTTLPQALKEIESAAAQFDALGFEIRDSTRRFGITAPGLPLTAKGGDAAGAEGVEGMAASTSAAGWGADGNPLLPGARAGEGLPGLPSVESSLNALQEFRERVEKGFGVDVDALLGRRRGEGAGGEQAGPAPANALTEFLERTGRQVAGGAGAGVDAASKQVMGALAAVRIVGQPKDGEEAKAWRERAVAEALARAEAAAEEARKAADRLFAGDPNWLTEAVSAPPEAAPTPQEIAQRLSAQATDKAAMRAAEAAIEEASKASGKLMDVLLASRAAGDAISPQVLQALEDLPPSPEFDDDTYDPAEIDKTYAEDSALWRIEQLFYFARRRWNEANTLKDEATSRDGLVGGPFIDPFPY